MKENSDRLLRGRIYLWYSLLFLLIFAAAFYPFYRNGKSLLWTQDAVRINYPAFHYLGTRIRDVVKDFLEDGTLQIPLFDFTIGYGQDIIQYLGTYYLDPINLLGALVKAEYMEYAYEALILLRIWASGISFLLLGRYKRYDDFGILCGAVLYAFSGYTFRMVLFLPCFGSMMLLLPLMIYGIEKILNGESGLSFSMVVAYSAVSGWYCLYINSCVCLIYVCLWLITHRKYGKKLSALAGRTAAFYILGGVMASIILLPAAAAYLNSARHDATILSPGLFHYEKGYLTKCLVDLFAPYSSPGYTTYINLSAWGILCAWDMWRVRKGNDKTTFLFLLVLFAGLLVPLFGFVFGGFNYVTNRWSCAFVFAVALATAERSSGLLNTDAGDRWRLAWGVGLAGMLILVCGTVQNVYSYAGFLFLLLCLCVVFLGRDIQDRNLPFLNRKRFKTLILLVISVNCVVVGRFTFSEKYGNYVKDFIDRGEVYASVMKEYRRDAAEIGDSSFYRIDFNRTEAVGASMVGKYNSVLDVFNELPQTIVDHAKEQLLYCMGTNSYYGLDSRAILDTLAGVKYFVQDKTYSDKAVPWGFRLYRENRASDIYENRYALPIGYAYTGYIDRTSYESLREADRQYAFLDGIVLEETDAESFGLPKRTPGNYAEELAYSIENNGIEIKTEGEAGTDQYVISRDNACLELTFTAKQNSETLLLLDHIDVDRIASESLFLPVTTSLGTHRFNIRSNRNLFRIGNDRKYLLNLGALKAGEQTCRIEFPRTGTVSIRDIKVYSCPMEPLAESVAGFMGIPLENIAVDTNRITADIRSEERIGLCFSIPYSKGWTAYVDGKKTELKRVNTMYMGLPLEPGTHRIELRYFTPGLACGMTLSTAALGVFLVCWVHERSKKIRDRKK